MKAKNRLIYYIICAYIILTPIIPDTLSVKALPLIHKIPAMGNVLLAVLILVFLFSIFKGTQEFKNNFKDFFTDPLGIGLIALLAIMVISISYATYRGIAMSESARFLSFVVLYFIIKYNTDKDEIKGMIKSYMVTYALINIYGIIQKISGIGLLKGYAFPGTHILRTNATFDNPNTFAAFLVIGAFPVLMMIFKSKKVYTKLIYTVLFLVTICNIEFTGSRNAFLALAVGAVILALTYSWYILFGVGGILVISFLIPMVRTRMMEIGSKTIDDGRIHIWKTALKMIENHPLGGVGNGNFIELYNAYVQKYSYLKYLNYSDYPTHNSFLKIESELGIVGGVSFITIIVSAIIKIKNVIGKVNDRGLSLFYIGFFASAIAFIFMNFFDNFFTVPSVVCYFWIFLATADSILYRERN